MTNIAENATVAQGVAQANAENNSVKTNEVANVSAIDALLQKHSSLIADAHNVQRTIVDWFTPPNDDYSINTTISAELRPELCRYQIEVLQKLTDVISIC